MKETLFDDLPPRQRRAPTSIEAAERIEPAAGTLRARVHAFLQGCGANGATDEEVQIWLGINPSTQRPRRVELVKAGLVVGPEGLTRETSSGRKAQVWRVVDAKGGTKKQTRKELEG